VVNERYFLSLYAQGARAVLRYLEQVERRIADAEARVERSQHSLITRLTKELTGIKATLATKSSQLREQQQLNHQLLGRIRELEHEIERGTAVTRDSHNSNSPPSSDPPWKKVPRTRSLRQKSGRCVGGQPGHHGATLNQAAHPDRRITHAATSCPGCGCALREADTVATERRQVFDLPEVRLSVTEHRAETRRCRRCGTEAQAPFPAGLRAPAQYGPGVLARSAYFNLYQLLPVARTAEALSDLFGCPVSPATVERAGRVFSGKLVRSEQRVKAAIREAPVVGADETGLRVAGRGGWVHVARTDALTHFAYDSRRGVEAMREVGILPQFTGTLVRDGYLSYTRFEGCRHSLCNAHLLRELVFVGESDPAQEVWTKPLAKLLLEIKEATAAAVAEGRGQLSEKAQSTYLARYDRLVKRADKLNPQPSAGGDAMGDSPKKKRPPLSPERRLINRLSRRRDEVLRFMTDLAVPFTNNGAERDLRMVKVQQKIGGCFRTEQGARDFCRVRGYLSTARKQGHPLLSALERVLSGKPLAFSRPAADTG
jgi:transposase